MLSAFRLQHKLVYALLLVGLLVISCAPTLYRGQKEAVSTSLLGTAGEPAGIRSADPPSPPSGSETNGSSACLGCHEYRQNHHPTEFAPADTSRFPFPLYNGQVTCLTCHTDNHMGNPFMLRGGPYIDRREICFQCHYEEEYRYTYPHIMLDSDGKVIEMNGRPVCLVCHSKTPDPGVDRTKDVAFRADVAFLCWRCHSLMARAILNQHVVLKPSINMLRYIERSQQRMKVTIPLVPRERITCSTCHNPHQKGVITYGPAAEGSDAPDRLRLQEPDLCVACHEM